MRVLFAASVGVATLGTNVDYGRLAASHLVHHFVGHRLGRTLALLRNNWNEIAERNDFLDLFENFLVLAMRNKDALDSCRLRHSQKLGDCAIILARFRDFVFIVRFRRIKNNGGRTFRERYDRILGKFKSGRRSFTPNDQFAKVRPLGDLKEADSLII